MREQRQHSGGRPLGPAWHRREDHDASIVPHSEPYEALVNEVGEGLLCSCSIFWTLESRIKVRIEDAHLRPNDVAPTDRELHQRGFRSTSSHCIDRCLCWPKCGCRRPSSKECCKSLSVYLLRPTAAGVLSIQHVPALWIDIGDKAYKVRRVVTYVKISSDSVWPTDLLPGSRR